MQNVEISLLYPNSEALEREESGENRVDISSEVLSELELDTILDLKNSLLSDFFTTDPEVIKYRQMVFSDMVENPELCDVLMSVSPILSDIAEIRRLSSDTDPSEAYLYSITEVELYISAMELLSEGLYPMIDNFKSEALVTFATRIKELTQSEYYTDLNKKLKELTSRVREIKSVTIGVNLDSKLRPDAAGVLSVNNEKFKSGELIDKILRLDFKNDEYTCIAPLVPFKKSQSENQQIALTNAFNTALNDVFKSSMRAWRKAVQSYVLENANFLIRLLPEIEFVVKGTELINSLRDTGNPLCIPTILPVFEKKFSAKGIYNPVVASKINDIMVENDFDFDENGTFYVLSGPNRGGKSVITCAVGLTFALAQLGLMVPAVSAEISPVDGIFTHFPTGSEDTIDKGRLGEECARLDEIFGKVTEDSLVLLDESLSSTGSFEGAYIASEVLCGFSMARCRGIFSTHLHELSSMLNEINEKCSKDGGARIDTLVAGMEQGQRSFKITRAKPDGKSYARDIADKYGISLEHILEKINKK